MNHEIVGPENRIIGRIEASELAMPGQQRIPEDIAIAKHIAQFWNPPDRDSWFETHDQHRTRMIGKLADAIGEPYELIKSYSWAQHNLLCELHKSHNDSAAKRIAENIKLIRSEAVINNLMTQTAAIL